jgi:hypothetical protein
MQIIIKYPKDLREQFEKDLPLLRKYTDQITHVDHYNLNTIDVNINSNIEKLTELLKILNGLCAHKLITVFLEEKSINNLFEELKCLLEEN